MKQLLISFGGLVLFMIALAVFPPLAIGIMVVGLIGIMFAARDCFDKNGKKPEASSHTTRKDES